MSYYMSQREEAALESMLPRLQAEGFSVFRHPSREMLPPFLGDYRPDAIAYRGNRKIAIEVISRPTNDTAKIRKIIEAFSEHPEWEYRVISAHTPQAEEPIPISPKAAIEAQLRRIEDSFDSLGGAAALLTGWSAFEAAARRLEPDKFAWPQPSSRLLEALAHDGSITPDEADMLRALSRVRNDVAHGRLNLPVGRRDVEGLVAVTRTLLSLDGQGGSPPPVGMEGTRPSAEG